MRAVFAKLDKFVNITFYFLSAINLRLFYLLFYANKHYILKVPLDRDLFTHIHLRSIPSSNKFKNAILKYTTPSTVPGT